MVICTNGFNIHFQQLLMTSSTVCGKKVKFFSIMFQLTAPQATIIWKVGYWRKSNQGNVLIHDVFFNKFSIISLIQSTREQALTQEASGYYYASSTNFNTALSSSFLKRIKLFKPNTAFTDQPRPFVGILYTDLNRKVHVTNLFLFFMTT